MYKKGILGIYLFLHLNDNQPTENIDRVSSACGDNHVVRKQCLI